MSAIDDFMKTFPEDIQEKAWAEANGSSGYLDSSEGALAIARAVHAERNRCAEVAFRYMQDIIDCSPNDDEAEKIRLAILDPNWMLPT
ncbi:hypothetical protein CPJ18_02725 [Agrobacterium rosae]|uniref:Uncharacterized protein n=1 Tax=Agrobacterium rosae TaxID=1972867 RepID=A0AAE5VRG0_9HYPH|nr:hypothetical protein [Agrobacterium rosae]POO54423.1 hypothetical protein CPJ18_02725 [Agrobacterium rosae]